MAGSCSSSWCSCFHLCVSSSPTLDSKVWCCRRYNFRQKQTVHIYIVDYAQQTCGHQSQNHPQANGVVERFHRQLKTALKAGTTSPNCLDELPMVLLGIRSSWRADLDCFPLELFYGSTLRIPGEFLQPRDARTILPDLPFFWDVSNKQCAQFNRLSQDLIAIKIYTYPPVWHELSMCTFGRTRTSTRFNVLMTDHIVL